MTVHALELSILIQIDFNVVTLRQKLSDQGEDVVKRVVEGILLHVCRFSHSRVLRFDERPSTENNCHAVFKFSHFRPVYEIVLLHEVIIQLYISDAHVLPQGLEANTTEIRNADNKLLVNLLVAPSKKKFC